MMYPIGHYSGFQHKLTESYRLALSNRVLVNAYLADVVDTRPLSTQVNRLRSVELTTV